MRSDVQPGKFSKLVAHLAHKPVGIKLTTVMMITVSMDVIVQLELSSMMENVSNEANVHVNLVKPNMLLDLEFEEIAINAFV